MKRVIIESPYAGDTTRHVMYARLALRDCLRRGEAPLASHLLYTQPGVLSDGIPEERALGIEAGLAWMPVAALVAFYTDYGWSKGMIEAQKRVEASGVVWVERRLWPERGFAISQPKS